MKTKSMGLLLVVGFLKGAIQRGVFGWALILILFSGVESHAQNFPDQQIIILKTNPYGMVYESIIQHVNGVEQIIKLPNTGLQQEFKNLKHLVEWMALYGYRLTRAIPMNTNIDERYTFTQYVFERVPGTFPILPIK